ncbi:50S ribosomal protein L17 [Candidatus Kuenenbacteria bacterium]|nr:50S ribosomal protein L17 [Candidatus Kuenenbacteria bacterium]
MRHRKKGKILDRKTGPRIALLKNLADSLVIHEKIKTTKAKAKVLRGVVEKLITIGKENNLTTYRKLLACLPTKISAKKILDKLGPKYKEKNGGYTRIIKLGRRKGDGAEMAQIEFV